MKRFTKFVRLVKVEDKGDGTCMVYGIATSEAVDSEGEICDYKSSKPYYKKWSDACAKRSKNKSLGNVRAMHEAVAAGKIIEIEFNDPDREVLIAAHIIDVDSVAKCLEGVYTGFSHGGRYVKVWDDGEFKRYTADPCEVSVVDNPSNPEAVIEEVEPVEKMFTLSDAPVAADAMFQRIDQTGSVRLCKFKGSGQNLSKEKSMSKFACLDVSHEHASMSEARDCVTKSTPALAGLDVIIEKTVRAALLKVNTKTKSVDGESLPAVAFAYVGDAADPSTWFTPIASTSAEKTVKVIRESLARFNHAAIPEAEKAKAKTKLLDAAKKANIDVAAMEARARKQVAVFLTKFIEERKDVDNTSLTVLAADAEKLSGSEAEAGWSFSKGMYNVSRMCQVLLDLAYARQAAEWERAAEEDDSTVPEQLQENLAALASTFLAMAEEETQELVETADEAIGGMYMSVKVDLQKAAKSAAQHLDSMKKAHTDHLAKMKKAHDDHCEAMTAAHQDHVEKMGKLHKDHCESMTASLDKVHGIIAGKDDDGKEAAAVPAATSAAASTTEADDERVARIVATTIQKMGLKPAEVPVEKAAEAAPSPVSAPAATEIAPVATAAATETPATSTDEVVKAVLEILAKAAKDEEEADDKDDDDKDGKDKNKKMASNVPAATGIGDRTSLLAQQAGPVIKVMPSPPVPVTKSQDADPTAGAPAEKITEADVIAATRGDKAAVRKLMKSAKPLDSIPQTLAEHLG